MIVSTRARQILIHGMFLVLCGLVWGVVVPHTPFPRLALTAHIQFMVNGMLLALMALLLLALPNRVGPRALLVMLSSAWLTWAMLASEVGNAWWGTKEVLPIVAEQAGATGGTLVQEFVVSAAHILSSLGLILSWSLLLVGFWGRPAEDEAKQRSGGVAS